MKCKFVFEFQTIILRDYHKLKFEVEIYNLVKIGIDVWGWNLMLISKDNNWSWKNYFKVEAEPWRLNIWPFWPFGTTFGLGPGSV